MTAAIAVRATPVRGRRWLALALVLVTLVASAAGGAAWAYWLATSTAGSSGASGATSVNAGATPTASANGSAVTVSWGATTLATGLGVSGYLVTRYDASTLVAQTLLSACTGTVSATSCIESDVPSGSWKYTVTPVFAINWRGAESPASATVVVTGGAPVAVADSYSVAENATLTVPANGVLGNDTGGGLSAVLVAGVAHGTLSLDGNGGFSYVPESNFNGTDAFSYRASNGFGDSETVTVTITVSAVNSAPVNSVPVAQQTPRNTNRVFSTANHNVISISDADAGASTVQVQLTATNGTITLPVLTGLTFTVGDGTADATMTFSGTIANVNLRLNGATFIPTTNFSGAASLQIVTSDLGSTGSGGAQTDTDTIAIAVNALGIFTANGDIGVPPGLAGSSSYSAGTYSVVGSGADIWNNSDHFQFVETALTGDGRLTARVNGQSQSPSPANGPAKAGVMFRTSLTSGSKHGMMDIMESNGSEFVWRLATDGASAVAGTAGINDPYWVRITRVGDAVTGERSTDGVTWVQQGSQTITLGTTIFAGLAVSAVDTTKLNTATFTSVSITTPPTAVADSYSVNEDTTLTVAAAGVLTNDTDPESNALTASIVSTTPGLTFNANGAFTYIPPSNFAGNVSFTYRASDGVFNSNTVTVTLTVKPANEIPSFTKGADQVAQNTTPATVTGWASAISQGAGESGQLVSFVATNNNNAMFSVQPRVSASGTLSYTPVPGVTGVATVSVRILDNGGTANGGTDTSAIQTFTITTTNDVYGPTGGSVDAAGLVGTGARYSTSTNLSVAFSKGTDSAGVAATGAQLQRATASLTSGTCGTFGGYALVAGGTDPVSPKTDTVADQACYRYHYVVQDTLGNPTTYASGDVKVDTTAPSAPSLGFSALTNASASGSTVYYRSAASSGGFTVTASGADSGSGIGGYGFPALGTGWASTPGALGVDAYTWTGTPAAPGTVNVTAINNAGAASPGTPFTLTADDVAPTAGTVTYANGSTGGSAISVSFTTGTDAGSGVGTRLLQRATAPIVGIGCGTYTSFATIGTNPSSPVLDTLPANSCAKYQYVVSDNVGNAHTAASASVAHAPFGAYWAFDAGSGTTAVDATGNGNTGTLQATAGWTAGKIGTNALNLTGANTSYVDVANPVIDTSQSYTVAAWVKLNNLTGFQTFASIDGTAISPFYLQMSGGRFNFGQRSADSTASTLVTVQGPIPTVGTWYHVAGVYNKTAGTLELFVNGVSQGTATATTAWQATGHTVIGRAKWNGAGVDFMNGALDEVRFFDRALTSSEIAALARVYTDTISGTVGLLNYWRLGETTITPMVDSKSGTNGTYVNAPTVGVTGAIASDTNKAVQFDGINDHATVARTVSTDFSIEFWFKSTQNFSDNFGQPACTQWWQGAGIVDADTSGGANDFGISLCSGKVVAGTGDTSGITVSVASPGTYNTGAWHHVVFTRTQSTGLMSLYVDSVLVGTATGTTNALTSTTTMSFGRRADGANYFAGTLDEVAIYTTVLPLATVQAHYAAAQ